MESIADDLPLQIRLMRFAGLMAQRKINEDGARRIYRLGNVER
jgi:hypothetical protein